MWQRLLQISYWNKFLTICVWKSWAVAVRTVTEGSVQTGRGCKWELISEVRWYVSICQRFSSVLQPSSTWELDASFPLHSLLSLPVTFSIQCTMLPIRLVHGLSLFLFLDINLRIICMAFVSLSTWRNFGKVYVSTEQFSPVFIRLPIRVYLNIDQTST